jgi:hypothetical protein
MAMGTGKHMLLAGSSFPHAPSTQLSRGLIRALWPIAVTWHCIALEKGSVEMDPRRGITQLLDHAHLRRLSLSLLNLQQAAERGFV